MKRIFLTLAILFWSQPLWAGDDINVAPPLAAMFEFSCRALDVPKPLVMAIAEVESGFHPWSLNIGGRSYRFDSKAETLAKAEEAWAAGRSFDLGLMQVNNWWLRKYNVSLETALDPLANIYFGGWILRQELDRHGGDPRAAVGAYHSPNPAKAARYAKQVMAVLERGPAKAAPDRRTALDKTAAEVKAAPLLIASRDRALAQADSMKVAVTAAHNSMKVKS